jgi:hypothetical protein
VTWSHVLGTDGFLSGFFGLDRPVQPTSPLPTVSRPPVACPQPSSSSLASPSYARPSTAGACSVGRYVISSRTPRRCHTQMDSHPESHSAIRLRGWRGRPINCEAHTQFCQCSSKPSPCRNATCPSLQGYSPDTEFLVIVQPRADTGSSDGGGTPRKVASPAATRKSSSGRPCCRQLATTASSRSVANLLPAQADYYLGRPS